MSYNHSDEEEYKDTYNRYETTENVDVHMEIDLEKEVEELRQKAKIKSKFNVVELVVMYITFCILFFIIFIYIGFWKNVKTVDPTTILEGADFSRYNNDERPYEVEELGNKLKVVYV